MPKLPLIGELEAGRELDALVSEQAMGGKWIRYYDANYGDPDEEDGRVHAFLVVRQHDLDSFLGPVGHKEYVIDTGECVRDRYSWVPKYSTDIAAAWEVANKIKGLCQIFRLTWNVPGDVWDLDIRVNDKDLSLYHDDFPTLICRAALKVTNQ